MLNMIRYHAAWIPSSWYHASSYIKIQDPSKEPTICISTLTSIHNNLAPPSDSPPKPTYPISAPQRATP